MKKIIPIATALLLFTQCSPAKMALEKETWQTREEYKVEGKRGLFKSEKMNFGQFHTNKVSRSWTKGSVSRYGAGKGNVTDYDYTNIISVDYIKRKQTLYFEMADSSNNAAQVYCVSKFNTTEIVVGNNPSGIGNIALDIFSSALDNPESKYYVQIYAKDEQPWQLIFDNTAAQMKRKTYAGYLSQSKDVYYTIKPVFKMENNKGQSATIPFGTVGYEFLNKEGKAVAAVSTLDKGVVYFQPVAAAEKLLLASACAALLLQDMIG
jgi:hypothetical protein